MADPTQEPLELEAVSPDPSPRAKARRITAAAYKFGIHHYCKVYARRPGEPLDRKTVGTWIRKGRAAENLPPLDEPSEMAAWWREVIGRKVPEVFETFEASKEKEGARPPSVPREEGKEGEYREMIEAAKALAEKSGLGFGAALDRAHASERLAWAQWQITLLHPDDYSETVRNRRKKAWEDALSAMRQAEVVAEKVMKRSEEWATWEEMERELNDRLVPIATGVRSLMTRVATKMTLPPGLFDRLAPAYQREVDALFAELSEGGFVERLELSAA